MDSSDKYTAENKGTVEMVKNEEKGLGMHTRLEEEQNRLCTGFSMRMKSEHSSELSCIRRFLKERGRRIAV
jgi:hypothetical protein